MRSSRRGVFIVRSLVSVSAIGIIGATAFLSIVPFSHKSVASTAVMVSPEPGELGSILTRVGLGPEALAAAGIRGPVVTRLVGEARTLLSGDGRLAALNAADETRRLHAEEVNRLRRLVQSRRGDGNTRDRLAQARIDLASATQSRDALLDAVYQAAAAELTAQQIATLRTLQSREDLAIPMPMRLADRDPNDWPGIRDAFNHTEQFEVNDKDYSQDASRLITGIRAEPQVSAADTNLSLYLAEVQAAFDAALRGD